MGCSIKKNSTPRPTTLRRRLPRIKSVSQLRMHKRRSKNAARFRIHSVRSKEQATQLPSNVTFCANTKSEKKWSAYFFPGQMRQLGIKWEYPLPHAGCVGNNNPETVNTYGPLFGQSGLQPRAIAFIHNHEVYCSMVVRCTRIN